MYTFRDYITKCLSAFSQGDLGTLRNILQSYAISVIILNKKETEIERIEKINRLFKDYQKKIINKENGESEWIQLNVELNSCFEIISEMMNSIPSTATMPNYFETINRKKIKGCIATEIIM